MQNKIYTLLKFSYKGDNEDHCFLPGMYCGTVMNFDILLDLIEKHLTMTNMASSWVPNEDSNDHLFFVKYGEEFEQENHHGFKVQITDTSTSKIHFLSKKEDKDAWIAISNLVKELRKSGE